MALLTRLSRRLRASLFGDLDSLEGRVSTQEQRLVTCREAVLRAEQRLEPLEDLLRAAEGVAAEQRLRLAELEERSATSETRVEETHARNDRLGGRLLRLEARLAGVDERLGGVAGRGEALGPRLEAGESRVGALEARLAPVEARGQRHEGRLTTLAESLLAADERTGDLLGRVMSLESRTAGLPSAEVTLRGLEARIAHLEQASLDLFRENAGLRERAERLSRIAAVTALLEHEPEREALVSVVLPTRNRSGLLAKAVGSVLRQRHRSWELLVVDDGSSDGTPELLASIGDPRVRVLLSEGVGAARARNLALDAARGELVAYLDDDNAMDPLWLHAVAWAFANHPGSSVLYGAQAVQEAAEEGGAGPLRRRLWIRFEPWDRARLERGNYVDLGAIAHRRSLPEARFDARVEQVEDWDLLLRLTRDAPPLELPVLCGTYRSDAAGRVSDSGDPEPSQALIRAKSEAARER